jgi:DNA repair protein RadC
METAAPKGNPQSFRTLVLLMGAAEGGSGGEYPPCTSQRTRYFLSDFLARKISSADVGLTLETLLCRVMPDERPRVERPASAAALVRQIRDLPTESLVALFLTKSNHVLEREVITTGSASSAVLDVPTILRRALLLQAASVVICHNHPSGSVEPSADDIAATRALANGLRAIGLTLLDHIVISKRGFTSLRDIAPEVFSAATG